MLAEAGSVTTSPNPQENERPQGRVELKSVDVQHGGQQCQHHEHRDRHLRDPYTGLGQCSDRDLDLAARMGREVRNLAFTPEMSTRGHAASRLSDQVPNGVSSPRRASHVDRLRSNDGRTIDASLARMSRS